MARACGTRAAYQVGCRCDPCRAAASAYKRARTRRISEETWGVRPPLFVDVEPARAHIEALRADGLGVHAIAAAAGISHHSVKQIVGTTPSNRPRKRLRATTAAAILAIRPDLDTLAAGAKIDATPYVRRMQALVALGWPQTWIADQAEMSRSSVWRTIRGRGYGYLTVAVARRIRDLYDAHCGTPGPSQQVRAAAARHGWVPPLAWDDIDLGTLADQALAECAVCVDVEHLADAGEPTNTIARRLGWGGKDSSAREAMRKHLIRHGRHDLVDRLDRRHKEAA